MNTALGDHGDGCQEPVQEDLALSLLDDLIADFEATYGPVPDELVQEAMREWPDYEDR
jgi:hypothetical protein